nr:hypothetical protein BgiMline_034832 [Biomphalaria glabrata]
MEPFSTSVFKVLDWNNCYYHQDLHPGAAPPRIASQASTLDPSGPSYSSQPVFQTRLPETARYRSDALAPSIFRAG